MTSHQATRGTDDRSPGSCAVQITTEDRAQAASRPRRSRLADRLASPVEDAPAALTGRQLIIRGSTATQMREEADE